MKEPGASRARGRKSGQVKFARETSRSHHLREKHPVRFGRNQEADRKRGKNWPESFAGLEWPHGLKRSEASEQKSDGQRRMQWPRRDKTPTESGRRPEVAKNEPEERSSNPQI
jgi:hypothetical protein